MNQEQGDVTQLLGLMRQGNPDARDRLIVLVYQELRRIAAARMRHEAVAHSLQPTALVHEAYVRLINITGVDWKDRAHFFAISSNLMRRILVEYSRARKASKRAGSEQALCFDEELMPAPSRSPEICALDEALNRLAAVAERPSKVVEMRYFAGMTEEEIGSVLGVTVRTVKRDWRMAKAWLFHELRERRGTTS